MSTAPRSGGSRKPKGKKGPMKGTGGHGRKKLEGKGPTPKAADREYHPAHKRAKAVAKRSGAGAAGPGGRGQTRSKSRGSKASSEMVYGRNSVVEALRAHVPVATMYVATRIDTAPAGLPLAMGMSADVKVDTGHKRHLFGSDETVAGTTPAK